MNTMKDPRRTGAAIIFLMAAVPFAGAQTQVNLATQSKHVDFSQDTSTKPMQVGPSLPPVCSAGQMFFNTSAAAGQNLYACTATNIWSLIAGSGGGSGGGVGAAPQLSDFMASDTSANVQTLGAACSTTSPCQLRVGTAVFTMIAPVTLTLSGISATGTAFWYLSATQILTVGYTSAATLTCSSGCSVVSGITAFPPDSIPLWQTTFTANVWDPINLSIMDKRAVYSRNVTAAGAGVMSAYNPSTGVQTLSTDPTQVPRYFAGSGAPSANCTAGRDLYTDTTGLNLYFCDATNTWKQAGGSAPVAVTKAYLLVPGSDVLAGASTVQPSGKIFCYDFDLSIPTTLTTAYQNISTAAAGSFYGVAIYDANGNRLTSSTQTGTTGASAGPVSVALGGGALTLSPSTSGRFSLCYTSTSGTLQFYGVQSLMSSYNQPPGNPIVYTGGNPATFASSTITWPATLGAKTAVSQGYAFPGTLVQ